MRRKAPSSELRSVTSQEMAQHPTVLRGGQPIEQRYACAGIGQRSPELTPQLPRAAGDNDDPVLHVKEVTASHG